MQVELNPEAMGGALAILALVKDPKAFEKRLKELQKVGDDCREAIEQAGLVGDLKKALEVTRIKAQELDAERAAFAQTANNELRQARTEAELILGNAKTEAAALVEGARAEAADVKAKLSEANAKLADAQRMAGEARAAMEAAEAAKKDYLARTERMEAALKAGA